jgi:hypothetical protein
MDFKDLRTEERVKAQMPIKLDGLIGLTHDISVNGICFEVAANYTPLTEICFVIEIDALGEKMVLQCKGDIVRSTLHDKKTVVAVKITESVIKTVN